MMPTTHDREPSMAPSRGRRLARILLVIPFAAMLWVPSYARLRPRLWGIPFFYWYQLLWIVIAAAITIIVYVVERATATPPRATRDS